MPSGSLETGDRLSVQAKPGRPATTRSAEREAEAAHVAGLQRLGIVGPADAEGLAGWVKAHARVKLPRGTTRAVDVLLQMRRESTR